jgi:hypothetical protein
VAQPRIHIEVVRGARRLHREDGAAVESDVEPLYFWHGVLVPPHAIERPESLTVEEIRNESNAEVRRALRERMGQGRYLREIGAKLIDADYEGAKAGAAPRALLEDDERRHYLVGTDGSTRRVYYMEVPATSKTCREAHEALCGFTEARIVSKS